MCSFYILRVLYNLYCMFCSFLCIVLFICVHAALYGIINDNRKITVMFKYGGYKVIHLHTYQLLYSYVRYISRFELHCSSDVADSRCSKAIYYWRNGGWWSILYFLLILLIACCLLLNLFTCWFTYWWWWWRLLFLTRGFLDNSQLSPGGL